MKNYLISAIVFCLTIFCFVKGTVLINDKTYQENADTLKKAINRASIQCYAIEGRYPSSVEYLEKNYGLQINHEKFAVFYEGFASNIKPDITVNELKVKK